jgi:hypothetical protein
MHVDERVDRSQRISTIAGGDGKEEREEVCGVETGAAHGAMLRERVLGIERFRGTRWAISAVIAASASP